MRPFRDAFGQAIQAYFKGEESLEIVERDDGFITASADNPKDYFTRFNDWPERQQQVMKFVKGRVLDPGCGAGRHSLYLQEQGYDVTGIDSSPLAITVCQERGLKKVLLRSISEIHKFDPGAFETIIMLGNNFGLFSDYQRARSLLKKMYRITGPDGRIIAESNDPYQTDNPFHLEYHQRNQQRGRMTGQLRIRIRFQRYKSDWFDYLLVSRDEMIDIVKDTGWAVKQFVDHEGSAYIGIIDKVV